MDRRGFLGMFGAAAVLDPERLLWVPGQKLISIPRPRRLRVRLVRGYNVVDDLYRSRVDVSADCPGAMQMQVVDDGLGVTTYWDLTEDLAAQVMKANLPGIGLYSCRKAVHDAAMNPDRVQSVAITVSGADTCGMPPDMGGRRVPPGRMRRMLMNPCG